MQCIRVGCGVPAKADLKMKVFTNQRIPFDPGKSLDGPESKAVKFNVSVLLLSVRSYANNVPGFQKV